MAVRRSVLFSTIANFGSQALSLALLIFTARWLYPEEIGAFAVAFAVIMLLEPVRDLRLTDFVVQSAKIDREVIANVQGIGLSIAVAGFLLCNGIAWVFSKAFSSDEPAFLLHILSFSFLVRPISQTADALLSRNMRFDILAYLKIAGTLFRLIFTVIFLLKGYGVVSLALGYLIEITFGLVSLLFVDREFRLPSPQLSNSGSIWAFCLRVSGATFLNRAATSLGDFIVGSFLGLAAAGFYNRAASLVRVFRSGVDAAITPIALASFASTERTDRARTRQAYLQATELLTGFSWPALGVLIVLANPLISLAYGDRWLEIIPLSRALAFGGIIYVATGLAHIVLTAIGAADALLKRSFYVEIPRAVLLVVAALVSIEAVAWSMVGSMMIVLIVNKRMLSHYIGISWRGLLANLIRSGVVGTCTVTFCVLFLYVSEFCTNKNWILLVIGLIGSALGWFGSIFLTNHPLKAEVLKAVAVLRAGSNLAR